LAGQRVLELVDDEAAKFSELLGEQLTAPTLDGDQRRAIGLIEVVHVEVIGGRGRARADLLEELADRGQATGALEPANVDVLAWRVDLEAKAQGVDGLVLADDPGHRLELARRLEAERVGIAAPAQDRGGEGIGSCVGSLGHGRRIHAAAQRPARTLARSTAMLPRSIAICSITQSGTPSRLAIASIKARSRSAPLKSNRRTRK